MTDILCYLFVFTVSANWYRGSENERCRQGRDVSLQASKRNTTQQGNGWPINKYASSLIKLKLSVGHITDKDLNKFVFILQMIGPGQYSI